LVGKPEGKRPLGRPRHRWEDNIKLNLQEVGFGGMDYIKLVQDMDREEGFKYLGTTFQEAIKSRLKSGNACYHSVQNPLSSSLLAKNIQIKIYRTIILPVVLYGCETWSLTLKEQYRLRVFENRLLRRIFVPKRGEVIGK
jgi:hypothetical protein